MTILIGGEHGVVFFGPAHNPRADRYWAERGLIHIETDQNKYITVSVKDFLERVQAVSDFVGNSTQRVNGLMDTQEIERQRRFVEQGIDLARKAQDQGLLGSSEAAREAKRRRPLTVIMPSAKNQF